MAKGIWSKNRDPNDHGLIGNLINKPNRDPNDHGLIGNLINKPNRDPNDHGLIGNMFNKNRDPNDHGLIGNLVGGLFGRKKPVDTTPPNTNNDNYTPPADNSGSSW